MNKPYSTYRICINHEDQVKVEWSDPKTKSKRELERPLNYSNGIVGNPEALSLLEAANTGSLSARTDTRRLGEILFEVLLDDVLMFNFLDVYQNIKQEGGYLRVELDINENKVPMIAALPWEFLCLPEKVNQGSIWLATDPNIVFSRHRALYRVPDLLPLAEGEKIKIAVVVSAPSGLGEVDFAPVKKLLEKLESEHGDKIEVLPIVNPATSGAIDEILDKKPHIFHFIGHGQLVKQNGIESGQIAFVDELWGGADWKDADFFAGLFVRHTPGIALMQACEGAKRSDSKALVDVAAKIGQQNVPVVVAMQYEVTNLTASQFALKFYECLAKDFPVDTAVQEGRYKVALNKQYQGRDFATPVIFSRVKDGHLFQRLKSEEQKLLSVKSSQSLEEQEISNNPAEIRKQIKYKALFIFNKVFNEDIEVGIPLLRQEIKDILNVAFLNRVTQRLRVVNYGGYIEELVNIQKLNYFIDQLLNKEDYIFSREDRVIQELSKELIKLVEKLNSMEE